MIAVLEGRFRRWLSVNSVGEANKLPGDGPSEPVEAIPLSSDGNVAAAVAFHRACAHSRYWTFQNQLAAASHLPTATLPEPVRRTKNHDTILVLQYASEKQPDNNYN
jgi:hypothetical protein